jgi:hypothetical protein
MFSIYIVLHTCGRTIHLTPYLTFSVLKLPFSTYIVLPFILVPCPIMVPLELCWRPVYASIFNQNSSAFIVLLLFEKLRCVNLGLPAKDVKNNHYLPGTSVAVKLGLRAGPKRARCKDMLQLKALKKYCKYCKM